MPEGLKTSGDGEPTRDYFPNYAGVADIDDALAAELEAAGITVNRFRFLKNGRSEVNTEVVGDLHGWSFKRAWYYWVAEGPGIELAAAERLHATHGQKVRVNGHCGCPSPREQYKGLAVGSYHVDSPPGLKALADTINGLVDSSALAAPVGDLAGLSEEDDEYDPDEPIPGYDCSPFGLSPVLAAYRLRKETRPFTHEDRRETADLLDRLCAEIQAHEDALTAPRAEGETQDGWRPIETAPKDGTEFLAAFPWGQRVVWWTMGGWVWVDTPSFAAWCEPTRWRPLSASPDAVQTNGGER